MTIIIKNKETLLIDNFKFRCSVGKKGFSRSKKEGDLKTPSGIFDLGIFIIDKIELKNLFPNSNRSVSKKTWDGVTIQTVKNIIS